MGRGKARLYASFIACRAVACPRVDDVYVHTRAGLDGTCGVAAYRSMDDAAAGRGREMRARGPLAGLFQVLLHWLLQKPCQTPNKKTASKLKP
jgi:hypothetical protein